MHFPFLLGFRGKEPCTYCTENEGTLLIVFVVETFKLSEIE